MTAGGGNCSPVLMAAYGAGYVGAAYPRGETKLGVTLKRPAAMRRLSPDPPSGVLTLLVRQRYGSFLGKFPELHLHV